LQSSDAELDISMQVDDLPSGLSSSVSSAMVLILAGSCSLFMCPRWAVCDPSFHPIQ
jgi:hypothetical protein